SLLALDPLLRGRRVGSDLLLHECLILAKFQLLGLASVFSAGMRPDVGLYFVGIYRPGGGTISDVGTVIVIVDWLCLPPQLNAQHRLSVFGGWYDISLYAWPNGSDYALGAQPEPVYYLGGRSF